VVEFFWHHSIARPRKPPATCKNLADISYTSRARISCLLDLSAAFDPIDHNILITRLSSWFGIHGSVLNWFKSYPALSVLNVIKTSLPSIFLPAVFLKALFSVLYFLSCILPHSALSTPHFLLTITFMQMILNFFSIHPRNFDSSIAHFQTALKHISSWMSANLLTLNSPKTEFLIIGLKQQLSQIDIQLFIQYHSFCTQPWFYLWWKSCFLWSDLITF